jgi:hypothetical protein
VNTTCTNCHKAFSYEPGSQLICIVRCCNCLTLTTCYPKGGPEYLSSKPLKLTKKWVVRLSRGGDHGYLGDMGMMILCDNDTERGMKYFASTSEARSAILKYITEFSVDHLAYKISEVRQYD